MFLDTLCSKLVVEIIGISAISSLQQIFKKITWSARGSSTCGQGVMEAIRLGGGFKSSRVTTVVL